MKKTVSLSLFALVAVACSSLKITTDFDSQANFSKYKTYALTEESQKIEIDQLIRDRIIRAVEVEMAAKGFTKSDSPDLLVDILVKTAKKVEATATSLGSHGYRYGYGSGFSTTQINYNEYVVGTLFINFIDKPSEKIAWQGRATKTLDEHASASKKEANINYAVKQIFARYPPKK